MFRKNKIIEIAILAVAFALAAAVAFCVLLRPSTLFSTLPSVTSASLGYAGDPINIVVIGDKGAIMRVFLAAHWLVPDPITASSTEKIIEASIANSAYPAAPVSNLYLFGRAQDLAFELPTDSARNRHHVRLWKTTEIVSDRQLWIGSATYDSGIELSGTIALPTHHISPNVDAEREFLSKSLDDTGLVQTTSSARISYPTFWGFNGGADWYFDDGLARVLTLY